MSIIEAYYQVIFRCLFFADPWVRIGPAPILEPKQPLDRACAHLRSHLPASSSSRVSIGVVSNARRSKLLSFLRSKISVRLPLFSFLVATHSRVRRFNPSRDAHLLRCPSFSSSFSTPFLLHQATLPTSKSTHRQDQKISRACSSSHRSHPVQTLTPISSPSFKNSLLSVPPTTFFSRLHLYRIASYLAFYPISLSGLSLSLSLAASAFSLLSFSLNLAFFLRSFGRSLFRIPYSYPSIPLPSLLIKPPTPVHQPARCITFFGSLSLSSTNRVWRKEGEHKGAGWVGHSIATVRLS
jgi:hypothetical protein